MTKTPRCSRPTAAVLAAILTAALLPMLTASAADTEPAAAETPHFDTPRALLEALERAGDGLKYLTAGVQYDKRFRLQGDRQVRRGELSFRSVRDSAGQLRKAFAITFTDLFVDRRWEREQESWIFDGQWLVETHPAQKQFIKRRIASADDDFDPLRIGEGPMPIPIGQPADDILAHFDATLPAPNEPFIKEEGLAKVVQGAVEIRLITKPQFRQDDDLREIRLWCAWRTGGKDSSAAPRLLPVLSRTINRAGDEAYVRLINHRTPASLPDSIFSTAPPDPGEAWDVQIIDEIESSKTGEPARRR